MQSREEKLLSELKADYDNIKIPETIDDYILKGIGDNPRKRPPRIKLYRFSAAAVLCLLMFASAIRFSPVFADYIDDVPILKYIVKLINYDKGLKSAVENDFVQNISVSDEHQDIKVTVDSIIVDQARMVVFYTLQNKSSYKHLELSETKFTDKAGIALEASYGYSYYYGEEDKKVIQDNIKVSFTESTVIPDIICMELKLRHKESAASIKAADIAETWKFEIPIDKSKFENMKEIYNLAQTVEIEQQKIAFQRVIVYPTRIEVQIEFADENTMRLFKFDDLRIVNEKGESLIALTNDVTATMPDANHINLYFESNYFSRPKELYLQGSSIRAVDKSKLDIIVDTDRKLLLQAPDKNIKLKEITNTSEGTDIRFYLATDEKLDEKFSYFVFSHEGIDAEGTKLDLTRGARGAADDAAYNQEVVVTIPKNSSYKSPIRLPIEDYPARIKGEFKVRIK